jgi:hypothetical protein
LITKEKALLLNEEILFADELYALSLVRHCSGLQTAAAATLGSAC